MSYQHLLIDLDYPSATITINREDRLNALNFQLLEELSQAFTELNADDKVRGIILIGAGNKAFVAGADIQEISELDKARGEEIATRGQALMDMIENSPKPVIACINGYALGGGCELAMACHIRIASENAVFGQPEINLGIIPGYGGTQRLTRYVGKSRALELMLTASTVNAEQAFEFGLVNYVLSKIELIPKAKSIIQLIATKPRKATELIIQASNATTSKGGFSTEAAAFGQCIASGDFEEGANAFLEKRNPKFD